MKGNQKVSSEKPKWDRSSSGVSMTRPARKLIIWLILLISVTYIIYTLKIVSTSRPCEEDPTILQQRPEKKAVAVAAETAEHEATDLNHVVFGIAASSKLWKQRKEYIKIWYKPKKMRGYVWLDKEIKTKSEAGDQENLPPMRISGDTASFPYKNKQGHRSAIRISRIVSETLISLDFDSEKNVRWFVMGDDDTVFVTDNLIRVLRKYDHEQMYYIGSLSESHLQNIFFSYGMAYGGGGFAISYPLAVALSKMQDRCIQRYPALYGSDDRMQACMAEIGVPLTKEIGFHQVRIFLLILLILRNGYCLDWFDSKWVWLRMVKKLVK